MMNLDEYIMKIINDISEETSNKDNWKFNETKDTNVYIVFRG